MHKVHVHDEFTLKSLKLMKVTEGKVMLLMTDNHEKCIWGAYRAFPGGAYLAKPDSAKSETAVQELAKPYFAKPGN